MSEMLEFRSPCAGVLKDIGPAAAAGVIICEETRRQAATVIALGHTDEVAARLQTAFGLTLRPGSKASFGNLTFVATGPRAWLALSDEAANLSAALRVALGDSAAVTEQSSGYTIFCISGPKARATFEKGPRRRSAPARLRAGRCRLDRLRASQRHHLADRRAADLRSRRRAKLRGSLLSLGGGKRRGIRT